jgi:hypothetical protein
MRKILTIGLIAGGIALAPTLASAGERLFDAGGGAVAGAIVGGPVGLVAGGLIGYTAGPHISRGLGFHRHHHRRHYHRHYTTHNGHRVYR